MQKIQVIEHKYRIVWIAFLIDEGQTKWQGIVDFFDMLRILQNDAVSGRKFKGWR